MKTLATIRQFLIVLSLPVMLFGSNGYALAASTTGFSDVPSDYLYYDGITYVQSAGIATGYPNGTFKPENPVNRAEFTKIVINSQYFANN